MLLRVRRLGVAGAGRGLGGVVGRIGYRGCGIGVADGWVLDPMVRGPDVGVEGAVEHMGHGAALGRFGRGCGFGWLGSLDLAADFVGLPMGCRRGCWTSCCDEGCC